MLTKLKKCFGCDLDKVIWKNFEGKKYCQNCWNRIKPKTENNQRNSTLPKQTKPIPKESPKREKEHVLYNAARLVYLKLNHVCKMNISGLCVVKATTVQHMKGRCKYYLDQRYWLPACWPCHSYCDTHPEEAIKNGWALPRIPNNETTRE